MVRQIMYVIQHGRTRKAWIDPKDIHNESDVPFVPPVYPTDEAKAEREERLKEKARLAEAQRLKDQHDDWNDKSAVPIEVPVAPQAGKVETPVVKPEAPKPKRKYTKRKGGKK